MLLKYDRNNPVIAVINASDVATNRQVERMVKAIQRQVTEHFRPAWGLQARLVFNEDPPLAMKVLIKDTATAEDKGFLGYHFVDGLPVTNVFAKDDIIGVLKEPFGLAPGGYMDVLRNGTSRTIWGPKAHKKKVRHRMRRRVSRQETP